MKPPSSRFPRYWACALLLLVAASYRLWLPVTDFPPIALVPWAAGAPQVLHWLTALGVILSAVVVVVRPGPQRWAWGMLAVSLIAAFILDQHRLQPWAYQSAIYAVLFATVPWAQARRLVILLTASIYLYSAAGKFDFQFAHTVGQQFLATVTAVVGGPPANLDRSVLAAVALLFPAVEFLVGITWLMPATRRWGGWGAVGMHSGLIAILGPWGLDHSLGVLTWNAVLIGQAWLLAIKSNPVTGRPNPVTGRPGLETERGRTPGDDAVVGELSGSESVRPDPPRATAPDPPARRPCGSAPPSIREGREVSLSELKRGGMELVFDIDQTPPPPRRLVPRLRPSRREGDIETGRRDNLRGRVGFTVAHSLVLAAVLLPLLERRGWWDHWLSWALYSPHNSRVELQIHRSAIDQLPRSAQGAIEPDRDGDGWQELSLGDWSLRAQGVPIYPQARYQLALAAAVAKQAGLQREVRAIVKGVSDRRRGTRPTTRLLGRSELERELRRYWFIPPGTRGGGFPRPMGRG